MKTYEEQIEELEDNFNYWNTHLQRDKCISYELRVIRIKQKAKELIEEIEDEINYFPCCECGGCSKLRANIEKLNKIIGNEE